MRFHCEDNYYFPDLVGVKSGCIDKYYFGGNELMLRVILDHVSDGMKELLRQYPMAFDYDFINKLMIHAYDGACKLKVNPDNCYHYSAKDHGVSKGVIILPTVDDVDLFMGKMIINEGKRRQTKVEFICDLDNDCFIPSKVFDVEISGGMAIQQSYSPKVLSKVKKYLNYQLFVFMIQQV